MFPKYYLWICLAAGILTETGMLLWLRRKEEKAERTEIGGDTGKETETAGRLSETEVPSGQAALCEEVKRMLEERLIKSNKENIQDLITNHHLYVKERRNLRKDK